MSGNCNHVDETLEMRYTSLRTAYPFPPLELPHTLGVRVLRGHSEPLLPSHPSPVYLFGPCGPHHSPKTRAPVPDSPVGGGTSCHHMPANRADL